MRLVKAGTIAFFTLFFTCLLGQSPTVTVEDTVMMPEDQTVSLAVTYTGPSDTTPIAFQGTFTYNTTVFSLTDIRPGPRTQDWMLLYRTNADSVIFGAAGPAGLQPPDTIAVLDFSVVSATSGSYVVDVPVMLADTDTIATTAGRITILNDLLGDVNQDGTVDTADAQSILNFVIGGLVWSDWKRAYADMDANGTVQAYDVGMILQQ